MSDRDFEIGSRKFKLSKLDPFKQFHILRRLTPILSDLLTVASQVAKSKDPDKQYEALAPIMNGISKLSDSDANLVLMGLLSAAEMQQPQGNWARVVSNDTLMFHDLELPLLMQIAWRAFEYNLSGFLTVSPSALAARG